MSGDRIQNTSVMLSASWWNFSSLSRSAFSVANDVALDGLLPSIDVIFILEVRPSALTQIALDDRSKVGRGKRLLEMFLWRLRKKTSRLFRERAARHEDHSVRLLRCHKRELAMEVHARHLRHHQVTKDEIEFFPEAQSANASVAATGCGELSFIVRPFSNVESEQLASPASALPTIAGRAQMNFRVSRKTLRGSRLGARQENLARA